MDTTPGLAKTGAAVLSGAVATLVVYVIDQVTGKVLPPEICASVQTIFTVLAVYMTPHSLGGS